MASEAKTPSRIQVAPNQNVTRPSEPINENGLYQELFFECRWFCKATNNSVPGKEEWPGDTTGAVVTRVLGIAWQFLRVLSFISLKCLAQIFSKRMLIGLFFFYYYILLVLFKCQTASISCSITCLTNIYFVPIIFQEPCKALTTQRYVNGSFRVHSQANEI